MVYLLPTGPQPIYGQDLNRFLQTWMVGIIDELDTTSVRPYTQAEQPVIPNKGTAWMAFRQTLDAADTFAYVRQTPDGAELMRQESFRVLCSFYDTGSNGQAERLSALLRDNAAIAENLEPLLPMKLVGFETPMSVPTLLSEQWLYRVDLPFTLRRQVSRAYAVPNIEILDGVLKTDIGIPDITLHVEENT